MTGRLGIDLQTYNFGSDLKDTARSYSTTRSRSSHFLDLSLAGPLGTSEFAGFLTKASLFGVFFSSGTQNESKSEYINPALQSYFAQMTFLPSRPFPLKFYHSSTNGYELQLEQNNRSDRNRLQPELSVVRRYRSSLDETGASWRITPSENVNILAEYKKSNTTSKRVYEFAEDRDVWVNIIGIRGRPSDTVFNAVFINETIDYLTITVYNLDSLENNGDPHTFVIENLPPGMDANRDLFPGRNYFSFQSPTLNPLDGTINVTEHLKIKIEYRDPATPNDLDQDQTSYTARIKLGGNGKIKNESLLEKIDQTEAVQKQILTSTNISNNLTFTPSRSVNVAMLTTFTDNETIIDTVSPQLADAWMHQTTVGYAKLRGWSVTGMHSINGTTSIASYDTLKSTLQTFTGRFSYPSRRWNHRLDMKSNISLLSDNKDYVNNKYTYEIINQARFRYGSVELLPKHQLKLGSNIQENPDTESDEIESKLWLTTTVPETKRFGDVVVKSGFEYRKRIDEKGEDIKHKYVIDASLRKKFSNGLKLTLMGINEWELFGGTAPVSGTKTAAETIHKSSYKVGLQGEPVEGLLTQFDFMIIRQSTTSIKKVGFSLLGTIPKLGIPIKSFLLKEYRDLADNPRQTQLSFEAKTNFRVRQITVIMGYAYRNESLLFETYKSHDFNVSVARSFTVF